MPAIIEDSFLAKLPVIFESRLAAQEKVRSQLGELEILSSEIKLNNPLGFTIFKGGVEAKYGSTKLKTDTLIARRGTGPEVIDLSAEGYPIQLKRNEAYALGEVVLQDEDIEIRVSDIYFSLDEPDPLDPKKVLGRASSFVAKIGPLTLKAKKATLTNEGWVLEGVSGNTTRTGLPVYEFGARNIVLKPGKDGRANGVRFKVLGLPLPEVPFLSFSLNRSIESTQIPQLSYSQNNGVGLAWNGNFLVGSGEVVTSTANVFRRQQPVFSAYYNRSPVTSSKSGLFQYVPMSDIGERAFFSHFENITFQKLSDTHKFVHGSERNLWSTGFSFNQQSIGRKSDRLATFSKPFEMIYERGGPLGDQSYLYQLRGMSVMEGSRDPLARALATGMYFTPFLERGRLQGLGRVEGGLRVDENAGGWFGGEYGASYSVATDMNIGASVYGYKNFGRQSLLADRFVSDQGVALRADLLGEATKLSLMWRYDPAQGWFDRQLRISQVMGGIEPVIIIRNSPREYSFGLRFRIDAALRVLQNRRTKPKK